jgi:hypothetical protein
MSGGGHMRSGSPDPLPVPPPDQKNGYRDDRAPYPQPERHRSQRRRDHDRSHGYAPHGEVRIWNAACECHLPCFDVTYLPCAFVNTDFQPRVPTDMPSEQVSRLIARNPDSFEHPDFQFSKCTGRKKAVCVSLQCPLHILLQFTCA